MKKLSIITIIASLLFPLNSFSQSNWQIGALGVFSKTKGLGAEIVDNIQAAKNLSIGFGTRPIKFEEHSKLYIPVFGTVKYYYPLPKLKLFASLDPGYGIYPSEDFYPWNGTNSFYRNGAIYLSGGVGMMGSSKLAPYASIYFTKFGFEETLGSSAQYRPISTFNISAGITLNRTTATNVFNQTEKPVALQIEGDYYKISKRQKNAARILLGTGIALIGSGIFIFFQQEDPLAGAAAFILISGPGIVSSLASIPFFISSAYNKRKIMTYK